MIESAVIDRFEEDWAVLLVGDDQRRVDVPLDALPAGVRPGQWLRVQLHGDLLICAAVDEDETDRVRRRIQAKLERLRRGEHREKGTQE